MKSVARMVKKLVRSVQRFLDPSKLFAIGDTHGSAMAIHFARAMGRQVAILIGMITIHHSLYLKQNVHCRNFVTKF